LDFLIDWQRREVGVYSPTLGLESFTAELEAGKQIDFRFVRELFSGFSPLQRGN
jgi:hypothetical protein